VEEGWIEVQAKERDIRTLSHTHTPTVIDLHKGSAIRLAVELLVFV